MREYLLTALVAAAATYLLVPLVRVFAIRIGAMPEVRDRDVHTTPTPRLGGLAMYGGLVAGLLVAANLPYVGGDGGLAAKELAGEGRHRADPGGRPDHADRLPGRLVGHGRPDQARRPDRRGGRAGGLRRHPAVDPAAQ
nr:hypothetical protein GCM10020093_097430 [Planobispora longispora]